MLEVKDEPFFLRTLTEANGQWESGGAEGLGVLLFKEAEYLLLSYTGFLATLLNCCSRFLLLTPLCSFVCRMPTQVYC